MTDREFVEQHAEVRTNMYPNSDCALYDGKEWRGYSWAEAACFVRYRLPRIAEVEEEIKVLRGYDADNSCHSARCMDRTLGRLESILADLKRGMWEKGAGE